MLQLCPQQSQIYFFNFAFPNKLLRLKLSPPPVFSGIDLSFKTRSTDGLLLAALSPGNQEEFVAIQIKDGRPYFLFDPQVRRLLTLSKNRDHEISHTLVCHI